MQELAPEVSSLNQTNQSSTVSFKKVFGLLLLLCSISASGYFFWQQRALQQTKPPTVVQLPDGENIEAIGTTNEFTETNDAITLPVGTCTPQEQVQLSNTSVLVFKGLTTLKAEPFCQMELTASGKYGPATYDCAYKLKDRTEIYLQLDDSGANIDFIRQHCTAH